MAWLRTLVIVLGAAASIDVDAQSQSRLYRIGYIQTATREEQEPLTRAFEGALAELGYVEGRNVVFERRFADGDPRRLPALAADLAGRGVDVIVTGGNPVVAAVRRATRSIPVVMATSRDPVGSGFAASLSTPGGNTTGMTGDPSPEVQGKRVELLKQAIPGAARVALLWNPRVPAAATYRLQVEEAARRFSLDVHPVEAERREDFEAAFAAIVQARPDALVVLPDPVFFTARKQIVAFAARHRLPAIYHAREMVEAGGFMSYGPSLGEQFRRAAAYVDRILKGATPGALAIEQATRMELVINREVARELAVKLPDSLLLQADVIGTAAR